MSKDIDAELGYEKILERPIIQQLAEKAFRDLEKQVSIPFVMKKKILMSPGNWNNYFYDKRAIRDAFGKTEWNPRNRALFLDHVDDRASEWIGEVDNIEYAGGNLTGDLIIVDKPTAIKLAYGAKFGVSPKVIGEADWDRKIHDFHFENFSIVINPAVKTTFLNQQIKLGGKKMPTEKELEEEASEEEAGEEETTEGEEAETTPETTPEPEEKINVDELAEKVADILAKKKKPEEEEMKKKKKPEEEEMAKKKPEEEEPEDKEKQEPKKKYPYDKYPEKQAEKEFDEFMLENITNSAWTDFVGKYIKAHKGEAPVSTLMKRAAKEFKKRKSEVPEVGITRMTVEDVKEEATKLIEAKMQEVTEPGIRVAEKYLKIPVEKQTAGDLDSAVFELMRRQGI